MSLKSIVFGNGRECVRFRLAPRMSQKSNVPTMSVTVRYLACHEAAEHDANLEVVAMTSFELAERLSVKMSAKDQRGRNQQRKQTEASGARACRPTSTPG